MRKNTGSMLDELEAVCITATRHAPQMRFSQVRFLVAAAKATRPQNFHPPGATHAELAKQTDVTPAAITRAVDVFGNGRKDRDQPGFGSNLRPRRRGNQLTQKLKIFLNLIQTR